MSRPPRATRSAVPPVATRGGLRRKLLRSHLAVAGISLGGLICAIAITLVLGASTERLTTARAPAVRGALEVLSGVQRSQAALRGTVVSGDEWSRAERARAWSEQIDPGMAMLRSLPAGMLDADDHERIAELDRELARLHEVQWWVEEVAGTPGNEPLRVLLEQQVEPIHRTIRAATAALVEVESGLEGTDRRPLLLAMQDLHESFLLAHAALRHTVEDGSAAEAANARRQISAFVTHAAFLQERLPSLTATQKDLLGAIEREFPAFTAAADELLASAGSAELDVAETRMAAGGAFTGRRVMALLEQFSESQFAKLQEDGVAARRLRSVALLLAGVLVLAVGGTAVAISSNRARRLARPIVDLSDAARRIAAGEPAPDLPVEGADEIGDLNHAFNQMRSEIERRSRTELSRANQRLAWSEQRFRATVAAAPVAMVMVDRQGDIILVNEQLRSMFGYEEGELVGQKIEVLLPERKREAHVPVRDAYLREGVEPRQMGRGRELRGRRKDGSEIPIEVGLNTVVTEEGKFALSAIADITERVRAQNELEESRAKAWEAARAKSEFLANMSHEIRTPMNAIIGLTDLVLGSPLDEVQRDHLGTVSESAEALLQVINDILDFSKIEAGKLELDAAEFSVADLVGDTLKSLALRAQLNGSELTYRVAPSVPEFVVGDPGRLRQVLVNLVGNAIKFADGGDIEVEVETAGLTRSDPEEVEVRFSVRDRGIGISADQLERIFQPFEQADSSTSREYGGTGLGLAITRRLVAAMRGGMEVESTVGEGSVFRFSVRLGAADPSANTLRAGDANGLRGLRVLFVDDHLAQRTILLEMATHRGLRPEVAADAARGRALLREAYRGGAPFDVLVVDANMPGEGGLEMVAGLREDPRFVELPVVLLSSTGTRGDVERGRSLGIASRLMKPVKYSDLWHAMAHALGVREPSGGVPRGRRLVAVKEDVILPSASSLRVLLAEDSIPNQKVALALLQLEGHGTVVAQDGLEAVAAFSVQDFDLVLMDVQMPRLDGFAATAEMREIEARDGRTRTPIVAMTAHALKGDREECLAAGMDEYVSKPVRRSTLRAAIERAIENARGSAVGEAPSVVPPRRLGDVAERAGEVGESPAATAPGSRILSPSSLDRERMLELAGGDHETLEEILEAYEEEMEAALAALPGALESRDARVVTLQAHKLKSALRFLGCAEDAAHAESVEQSARSGSLAECAEAVTELGTRAGARLELLRSRPVRG